MIPWNKISGEDKLKLCVLFIVTSLLINHTLNHGHHKQVYLKQDLKTTEIQIK